MTNITNHASNRLKERSGLNKKSQQRIVDKAFELGMSHNETKGNLNKWISKLFLSHKKAGCIKLYGDKAYLFTNKESKTLITIIQIPNNLKKYVKGEN